MADDENLLWVDSMPQAYENGLVPAVFRPFAVDLAARAARLRPRRILEVAAGTGVLTRELAASLPNAEITATDLNPAMVLLGSQQVQTARWEQADGAHLRYADGQFDLVVCQFGVMFFPDKPAAFAEAARVLALDGRLLFNTWDVVATHGFDAAVVAGLERAFPVDPPTFLTTVPHGYADPRFVQEDLLAACLECVSAETIVRQGDAPSAAEVAVGFCTGTPLRAAIEARGDLAIVTSIVSDEMTRRLGPGPVSAQMSAHVFEARVGSPR